MEQAVLHAAPRADRSQATATERSEQRSLSSNRLMRCLMVERREKLPRGSIVRAGFDSESSLSDRWQHQGEWNDAGNPHIES